MALGRTTLLRTLSLINMCVIGHASTCSSMTLYAPSCSSRDGCQEKQHAPLTQHSCGSSGDTTGCCKWFGSKDGGGCMVPIPGMPNEPAYPCYEGSSSTPSGSGSTQCSAMTLYAPSCSSRDGCQEKQHAPLTQHSCGSSGDTTGCCKWFGSKDGGGCMVPIPGMPNEPAYPCYEGSSSTQAKFSLLGHPSGRLEHLKNARIQLFAVVLAGMSGFCIVARLWVHQWGQSTYSVSEHAPMLAEDSEGPLA